MSEVVSEPFSNYTLPPDYEYLRNTLGQGYEQFRHLKTTDFQRLGKQAVFDAEIGIEYRHIVPEGNFDESFAVLVPHSMGNNDGLNWSVGRCGALDAVHFANTCKHLQFITFPSPNLRQPYLTPWKARKNPIPLNREERAVVRSGDFSPVAERMKAVADKKQIGKVFLYAYSGGAPPAVSLAERLVTDEQTARLSGAILFDPAGVPMKIDEMSHHETRDGTEMLSSYIGSAPGFFESVMNSGSEAWADIQQGHYPQDLWGLDGQIAGTLQGIISSYVTNPSHIAIRKGYNQANIVPGIETIVKAGTSVRGYLGDKSKIARGDGVTALLSLSDRYLNFDFRPVSPGDHGTFNLLPLCTGLAAEQIIALEQR